MFHRHHRTKNRLQSKRQKNRLLNLQLLESRQLMDGTGLIVESPLQTASAIDHDTGNRIVSVGNPDGSKTTTTTTTRGEIIAVTKGLPSDPILIGIDHLTGITTRITDNGDGTRTATRVSAAGTLLSTETRGETTRRDATLDNESLQTNGLVDSEPNPSGNARTPMFEEDLRLPTNHIEPQHVDQIFGGGTLSGGDSTREGDENRSDDTSTAGSPDGESGKRQVSGKAPSDDLLPPNDHIEPGQVEAIYRDGASSFGQSPVNGEAGTDGEAGSSANGDDFGESDPSELDEDRPSTPNLDRLVRRKFDLEDEIGAIQGQIARLEQTIADALDLIETANFDETKATAQGVFDDSVERLSDFINKLAQAERELAETCDEADQLRGQLADEQAAQHQAAGDRIESAMNVPPDSQPDKGESSPEQPAADAGSTKPPMNGAPTNDESFNLGALNGFGTQTIGAVEDLLKLSNRIKLTPHVSKAGKVLGPIGNVISGVIEFGNSPGTTNADKALDAALVGGIGFYPPVGILQAGGGLIDLGASVAGLDGNLGVGDVIGQVNTVRFARALNHDVISYVTGNPANELDALGKASLYGKETGTVTKGLSALAKFTVETNIDSVLIIGHVLGLHEDPRFPPEIPTNPNPLSRDDIGPIPVDVPDSIFTQMGTDVGK